VHIIENTRCLLSTSTPPPAMAPRTVPQPYLAPRTHAKTQLNPALMTHCFQTSPPPRQHPRRRTTTISYHGHSSRRVHKPTIITCPDATLTTTATKPYVHPKGHREAKLSARTQTTRPSPIQTNIGTSQPTVPLAQIRAAQRTPSPSTHNTVICSNPSSPLDHIYPFRDLLTWRDTPSARAAPPNSVTTT
jgi:hypothetical protein